MNVLITGGAGFFGSKLSEKFLKKGYRVTVYDNLSFGDDGCKKFIHDKNYTLINADVRDFELLKSVVLKNDIIVHMAALVGEPICKANRENVYKINTEPVEFLSSLCDREGKQFLFLSTCSNYGKNTNMVNEESELNPLGLYSDSKIKAENYIINNVKSYLILRCSTLFGVSHRMRVDLTINQFLFEIFNSGGVSVYGESAWRPYLHVDDACNMIIMAIDKKLTGVYNLGNESLNYTKKQIIDELRKFGDFKIEYVYFDDPRDYKVNFSKINSVLDYKIKFDLETGIDEISGYLNKEGKIPFVRPMVFGNLKKGEDVFIDTDSVIKRPNLAKIGSHVAIDKGFYCTTSIEIGDYTHISPYVTCIGGENGKFTCKGFNNIMTGARIICSSDRFDDSGLFGSMIPDELKGKQITIPVVMEEFSNIGTNSIVMPGSTLRRGVLLCAGSLLIGDTEEWGVYKGSPAVLVKKIDPTKILENAKKLGYEL